MSYSKRMHVDTFRVCLRCYALVASDDQVLEKHDAWHDLQEAKLRELEGGDGD